MSEKLVKGRKPFKQAPRRQVKDLREDDLFGNMLKLDPDLEKELAEKGLEARFVDAGKLYAANGYHPKGWTVYKRQTASGTMDFKFGNDPEGIIRRGTMILAVKSKEQAERHREFLRQKAELYNSVVPRMAEELRRTAKENNVDAYVDETYGEDDDQ